jgi:hypothetical protein
MKSHRRWSQAATMTTTPMLPLIASIPLLICGCDPCEPKIVQVLPDLGIVRVSNDCYTEVDFAPLELCHGQASYAESCASLDTGALVPAGACMDIKVDLPLAPTASFGIAVFHADQNKLIEAPIDNAVWGLSNNTLLDASGDVAVPAMAAILADAGMTRGEDGWYSVPAGPSGIACATWAHVITLEETACVPRLVEVHPGPSPFLKIAMPPGCPAKSLEGFAVAWGGKSLSHVAKLPASKLIGGDCLVVGDEVSDSDNGWAQWAWSHLAPSEIGSIPSGANGPAMAALLWGGEANSGVVFGAVSGQPPTWPNLDNLNEAVPSGRSIRWDGKVWSVAPTAANQCPRWHVLGD